MIARETNRAWRPHDRNRLVQCGQSKSGDNGLQWGKQPGRAADGGLLGGGLNFAWNQQVSSSEGLDDSRGEFLARSGRVRTDGYGSEVRDSAGGGVEFRCSAEDRNGERVDWARNEERMAG